MKTATETSIPEKNLEKMLSTNRGGMIHLIMRESMGGNAGHHKGLPCAGANFYFVKDTGEIDSFSNYPVNNPQLCLGTFRAAYHSGKQTYQEVYQIVDLFTPKETPKQARANLERSMLLYALKGENK